MAGKGRVECLSRRRISRDLATWSCPARDKKSQDTKSRGYKVWVEGVGLTLSRRRVVVGSLGGRSDRPLCSLQSRLFRACVCVNLGQVGNWVKKDGNFRSPLLPFQRSASYPILQATPSAECGAAGIQRLKISDQGHEAERLLCCGGPIIVPREYERWSVDCISCRHPCLLQS